MVIAGERGEGTHVGGLAAASPGIDGGWGVGFFFR